MGGEVNAREIQRANMCRHDDGALAPLERGVEVPARVPANEIQDGAARQERHAQEIDPDGGEMSEGGTSETSAFGPARAGGGPGQVLIDCLPSSRTEQNRKICSDVRQGDRSIARKEPKQERAGRDQERLDRCDRHRTGSAPDRRSDEAHGAPTRGRRVGVGPSRESSPVLCCGPRHYGSATRPRSTHRLRRASDHHSAAPFERDFESVRT